MNKSERNAVLSQWIKPSSDHEKAQQDRAERMVVDAVKAHHGFDGAKMCIYTKGSYPNNTNVRRDSDVDVVVELQDVSYTGYRQGVTPGPSAPGPYEGPWTPAKWRAEVVAAMRGCFGDAGIDATGNIAIQIHGVDGSRPSADVVPSFLYYRYNSSDHRDKDEGSCVWSAAGEKVVNWPSQQLDKGRSKNTRTGQRYKNFTRALKNAENHLASQGLIGELPSYFMECLVFNIQDSTLQHGDLQAGFRATLVEMYQGLDSGTAHDEWVEPNWMKYLFKGHQKWDVDDGRKLVQKTWDYFGYGAD